MVGCNIPCDDVIVAVVSLVFMSLSHGFSHFVLADSEEVSLLQVITTTPPKLFQTARFQGSIQTFLQAPTQIIRCLSGPI